MMMLMLYWKVSGSLLLKFLPFFWLRNDDLATDNTVILILEETANVLEEHGFYLYVSSISCTFFIIPNMWTLITSFERA